MHRIQYTIIFSTIIIRFLEYLYDILYLPYVCYYFLNKIINSINCSIVMPRQNCLEKIPENEIN